MEPENESAHSLTNQPEGTRPTHRRLDWTWTHPHHTQGVPGTRYARQIHHRDGDPGNHDIANLVMVESAENTEVDHGR